LTVYVGTDKLAAWLRRRRWSAVTGSVVLATFTPFCSCGTTAVVLGMIAAEAPWAPVVAFMVASPLTSPSELLLSAGLFGWPFALLYFAGATGLGFAAGGVAGKIEDRGLLVGQARMAKDIRACTATDDGAPKKGVSVTGVRDGVSGNVHQIAVADRLAVRLRLRELAIQSWRLGRKIIVYFLAYTALGYLLIELVPTAALLDLLGGAAAWAVPLAALLGIPVYITSEASLPMVAALMHGGLGPGPAMAFLTTGAGTSVGAISGTLLIARRRVVGIVLASLLVGAVVLGWTASIVLG
jgi:uncharacterized membrane protein YraQ (UPF0718 family)